jgi:hypothetical protein
MATENAESRSVLNAFLKRLGASSLTLSFHQSELRIEPVLLKSA